MGWDQFRQWYTNKLRGRRRKSEDTCQKNLPQQLLVLCRHIAVNGSKQEDYAPINIANRREVKRLKRHLVAENVSTCSQFTIEASIVVLRYFLRHLPYPLLHDDLHTYWARLAAEIQDGKMKESATIDRIKELFTYLSFDEMLVIRNVVAAVWAICYRLGYCDIPRLLDLANYLGPCLTSSGSLSPQLAFKRPCKVGPVILRFLIEHKENFFSLPSQGDGAAEIEVEQVQIDERISNSVEGNQRNNWIMFE